MITLNKIFRVSNVATDATSFAVWVKRNDTNADVVGTSGSPTAMTHVATGTYQLSFAEPALGLLYTATYTAVYSGQTYVFPNIISGSASSGSGGSPGPMTTSYNDLTTRLAWDLFGLRPDGTGNVWQTPVVNSQQLADITACIRDGLNFVYSSWRWSFLRSIQIINTIAPYSTGTLVINATGNVTLTGGTFPSNSASANGQIAIKQSAVTGIWVVKTFTDSTHIVLANYNGGAIPALSITLTAPVAGNYTLTWNALTTANIAFNASATAIQTALNLLAGAAFTVTGTYPTFNISGDAGNPITVASGTATIAFTGTPYQLVFNRYSLPTGYDTSEEEMTEVNQSGMWRHRHIKKIDELQIRHRLQHDYVARRPEAYALTNDVYTATNNPSGPRYVTFWPIPEAIHTFQFKATLRPTMIDSTNQQPLGDEVLAPCLMESCLASAERLVKGLAPTDPKAVHNQALPALLQMAMDRDKQYASPDTLGVDYGDQHGHHHGRRWRGGEIHLIGGFGGQPDMWIGG